LYENDSPGSNTLSSFPVTVKFRKEFGFVLGRVTSHPQLVSTRSVSLMLIRPSFPSFVTVILNVAFSPTETV
jgi:hypothetical protein